jgi:heme A synthase
MESPWLHRYAVFVAVCTLVLVVNGAFATAAASGHRMIGIAVGALLLGLAVWFSVPGLRWLGWGVLAVAIAEGLLGIPPKDAGVGTVHAWLAQILFAATVAIAVVTSGRWKKGPELVKDSGWPSLRSLAIATPTLALVQAALGAAYRHEALGLMPHFTGALVVALVNLAAGMFATQQFPQHASLLPAAKVMMGITFFQVFLGIAIISLGSSPGMANSPAAVILRVTHVATGALTVAATVVFAMQVRRNVRAALV